MTEKIMRVAVCTSTGFNDEAHAWTRNYCDDATVNDAMTMRAELKYRPADDNSTPFEYTASRDGLTRREAGLLMNCKAVRITIEPCDSRQASDSQAAGKR